MNRKLSANASVALSRHFNSRDTLVGLADAQGPFTVVKIAVERCAIYDGVIGERYSSPFRPAATWDLAVTLRDEDEDGAPMDEEVRAYIVDCAGRRIDPDSVSRTMNVSTILDTYAKARKIVARFGGRSALLVMVMCDEKRGIGPDTTELVVHSDGWVTRKADHTHGATVAKVIEPVDRYGEVSEDTPAPYVVWRHDPTDQDVLHTDLRAVLWPDDAAAKADEIPF